MHYFLSAQRGEKQHIVVFKRVVLQDLKDLKVKKEEEPKYIKSVILKLNKRKDLVIRPADKDGGIVVLGKAQYNESIMKVGINCYMMKIHIIDYWATQCSSVGKHLNK